MPASSLPPSSIAPSNSLVSRTQRWVEENKYLVLGAAVVAAGGMGYYLYANQPAALVERNKEKTVGESSSDEDARSNVPGSTSQKSKKKKKSKSKKSSSTGKSDQGPLLEERDPEEVKRLQEARREEESQNKQSVTSTSTSSTTTTETKPSSSEPAEKPSYLEGIPEKNELYRISAEVSPPSPVRPTASWPVWP
jgi:cytoskeletal protein RodZ